MAELRSHLINTCEHIRPRGKSRGARKKELVSGEYLFWQADLLAEGFQAWVAAKQSAVFAVLAEQKPTISNRPNRGIAIQGFENAVLGRRKYKRAGKTGGCEKRRRS